MLLTHPRRIVVASLVTLTALVVTGARDHTPPAAGYGLHSAMSLGTPTDRVRGRIELLEDARITPDMRHAIADAYGGDPCAGNPAALRALCHAPDRAPLRHAMLRLVDARGRVVATQLAERPLAELSAARLYGSRRRTYLYTVDLGIGAGSYAGPLTRLLEPDARGFGWLTADSAGVARGPIALVSTLKSAWRFAPQSHGKGQDLLMLLCRPDLRVGRDSTARFVLTYKRYTFTGGTWRLRQRQAPGCFESDQPFPPASDFP